MTEELYPYYRSELRIVRQLAEEFAKKHSKVAGRLQIESNRCEDPHVERLFQAFALVSARIRYKLDEDFPEITSALLDLLYPHYLRPIPSMGIAQIDSEAAKPETDPIAAKTVFETNRHDGVRYRFRTGFPVKTLPVGVAFAAVQRPAAALTNSGPDVAAVIRIMLHATADAKLAILPLSPLQFCLSGQPQVIPLLYELLFTTVLRVRFRSFRTKKSDGDCTSGTLIHEVSTGPSAIQEVGFDPGHSLLPIPPSSFPGYVLLQEYFSFPDKFHFFDLAGLDNFPSELRGDRLEIVIELNGDAAPRIHELEHAVNEQTFRLGCTPVINLYPKPSEPIRLDHRAPEYKVVADANQDNVVEVYSVEKVTSMTPNGGEPRVYAPLYSLQHVAGGGNLFWYASRKPRIDSCKSRRAGDQPPAAGARTDAARNARPATDVLLSFVDLAMREQQPDEKAVLAHVLCTNGDVAQHLKGSEMRQVKGEAKASFIGAPSGASAPPDRSSGQWRLISHLALNSLSMVESGKEALQEILRLYDPGQPPDQRKDIGAIIALRRCRRMARMASDEGVSFCPGISVEIDFDERLFDGGSPYLMAAVLNRFLGLYSAVNSFTQLTAYTMGRTRPLKIWPARKGEQVIL